MEENKVLMTCLTGSRAYGTSTPTSDTDIRGIFCAPKKCIVTPWHTVKEQVIENEEDGKLYELTNFMKLYVDQNPNILELLFVHKDDVLSSTPEYDILREAGPKLLSRKTAFTFSGYAMSQMNRIKGHDKWINNPQPESPPTQIDFVRLVHSWMDGPVGNHEDFMRKLQNMNDFCILVPYGNNTFGVTENFNSPGIFNADGSLRRVDYDTLSDKDKKRPPIFIVKYLAEDHRLAKEKHGNYWTWKQNRNEARHALEVAYGYDTKHAMHLVRLMRMAEEILTEGKLLVRRPDAKELLDIRNGAWSYEQLIAWAEEKDEYIRNTLYPKSPLRRVADIGLATEVLMEVQDRCWK